MMNLLRDIRYSARSLWKAKGFSIAVIATLALCIGVNTTMLSVLYDLVLKPLPFESPDRIVKVFNVWGHGPLEYSGTGWKQYQDFRDHADLFEEFAIELTETKMVGTRQQLEVAQVTADYFDVMRVQPLLGRFFTPEEVYPGPGNVLVLAQSLWESEYAADPDVIGQEVRFHNEPPLTIVGVAPRSLEALDAHVAYFTPMNLTNKDLDPYYRLGFYKRNLWGRLKPDVSREQALTQLLLLERQWYVENADAQRLSAFDSVSQRIEIGKPNPFQVRLSLLQGGAFLLLALGCANAINLQLYRVMRRCHELSIRHSLGATPRALARLMVCESFMLASAATLVGLTLAWSGLHVVNRYLGIVAPNATPVALSSEIVISTSAIGGGVALIMGLIPIAILWKGGHVQKLGSSTRGASANSTARALSTGLVVSQVAIAFALLIGASLLFQSFRNVLNVDPGYNASRVMQGRIALGRAYPSSDERKQVRQDIIRSMMEIPGVECASWAGSTVGKKQTFGSVCIRGSNLELEGEEGLRVLLKHVSYGFFETMDIPILNGRSFNPSDDEFVYIVDEGLADAAFGSQPVLGAEMKRGGGPLKAGQQWSRVVGVARRANFEGLEGRDGLPVVYVCNNQQQGADSIVLLRVTRPGDTVISEAWAKLNEINPAIPMYDATSTETVLSNLHLDRQGITMLVGILAGVALALSSIGIYSVLAYDVQQRHREFGIRSALGAGPQRLLCMVVRQGLWKAGVGLALGLLGSLYLSRFLESQLFDVTALEPWTYTGVLGLLLMVACAASYFPARRAVRVDPMEALRTE